MTISTTIIKNSYSGDGSVVALTYAFKIADATFIEVIVPQGGLEPGYPF